jgi:hypothetical protein
MMNAGARRMYAMYICIYVDAYLHQGKKLEILGQKLEMVDPHAVFKSFSFTMFHRNLYILPTTHIYAIIFLTLRYEEDNYKENKEANTKESCCKKADTEEVVSIQECQEMTVCVDSVLSLC